MCNYSTAYSEEYYAYVIQLTGIVDAQMYSVIGGKNTGKHSLKSTGINSPQSYSPFRSVSVPTPPTIISRLNTLNSKLFTSS